MDKSTEKIKKKIIEDHQRTLRNTECSEYFHAVQKICKEVNRNHPYKVYV